MMTQKKSAKPPPRRTRLGWFIAFATSNFACVVAILVVQAQLRELNAASLNAADHWSARSSNYAKLRSSAALLNAPGNDVFSTRDTAGARAALHAELAVLRAGLADCRAELRGSGLPAASIGVLDSDLARVGAEIEEMVLQADAVLREFEAGALEQAGVSMAAMDAGFAEVNAALMQLEFDARRAEVDERKRAHARMAGLDGYRIAAEVLVALVIGAALVYGVKLRDELIRDERRLREQAERALEANRTKSEFLAHMGHELRTPLTAILGYADLLLEPRQSPDEQLDCLRVIRRNGAHLLEIVNDLLDLSKIEEAKIRVDVGLCEPLQLIEHVLSTARVQASEKSLALDVEFDTAIPAEVHTDAMRFRRVLFNLVGNAIKFTDRGGVRLRVRFAAPDGQPTLTCSVVDTGIGIPEHRLAAVFEPFEQSDVRTTRRYGGTGLGLSISRRLANLLGGDVTVESSVGIGSIFHFTVSAPHPPGVAFVTSMERRESRTPARTAPPLSPPTEGAPERLGRILLAEDGPDNQRLISRLLERHGAEVTVVGNGRLAVEYALRARSEGQPYDAVLMDMQVPELDGYGATSLLRTNGYTSPIIALTAHALEEDRMKCLQAGCDDYATKPVVRADLIARVRRCCSKERSGPAPSVPVATEVSPNRPRSNLHANAEPLISMIAGDDEARESLRLFVEGLSPTIRSLCEAVSCGDRDGVVRLANQVQNASASHGYPAITSAISALGSLAQQGAGADDLRAAIDSLEYLRRRAATGLGPQRPRPSREAPPPQV